MNMDDATKAYIASQDLRRVYNAYRATSRANIWVMRNIRQSILNKDSITETERTEALRQLQQREALSVETALVFKTRVDQLQRRITELENLS